MDWVKIGEGIWVKGNEFRYCKEKPSDVLLTPSKTNFTIPRRNTAGEFVNGWQDVGFGCWFNWELEFNYWYGPTPPTGSVSEIIKQYKEKGLRFLDREDRIKKVEGG
ncbi:MAG: hypothetical protein ABDH28_01935 [Brevinematia bacterium]